MRAKKEAEDGERKFMDEINKREKSEQILSRILSLAEAEFESDAALERALGLKDKTVSNWRRGRSSSYMKMLPQISEILGANIGELMDIPLRKDTSELSEEELHLLNVYRRSRAMPPALRSALAKTLEGVIDLYVSSAEEIAAPKAKRGRGKSSPQSK